MKRQQDETIRSASKQWGWMLEDVEHARGPFASEEAAIADARNLASVEGWDAIEIRLGTCRFYDPTAFMPCVDGVIEHLEQSALEGDFCFWDDELLSLRGDKEAAQTALNKAVEGWLREHTDARTDVWVLEATKSVVVAAVDADGGHQP